MVKASGETENEDALTNIRKIFKTLQGKTDDGAPVSVEVQVNQTISAATAPENLVQMFPGWCPWI